MGFMLYYRTMEAFSKTGQSANVCTNVCENLDKNLRKSKSFFNPNFKSKKMTLITKNNQFTIISQSKPTPISQ